MTNYRLKDNVFAFFLFKNTESSYIKIREILSKGSIVGNEKGIRLITPILECLSFVKVKEGWQELNNELWGIGVRISALDYLHIPYSIQNCKDVPGCRVLTIPTNTSIDIKGMGQYDVVVLCPTKKAQELFYKNKLIGKKNWPTWHWPSLSCKYILDYKKDDSGLDKFIHYKFNQRNYQKEEINPIENVLF